MMLVIHPCDRTTAVLSVLYEGGDAKVVDQRANNVEIRHLLHHVSRQERIMLLGHGSDKGLFSRQEDTVDFDRIVVGHSHAYYLRHHGANIVAVWCNANLFAKAEGLHGLFSGMIISEMSEAAEYGVQTTQEELDREIAKLSQRLRRLLDAQVPLNEIPARMLALDDVHTPLTAFNSKNFFYL